MRQSVQTLAAVAVGYVYARAVVRHACSRGNPDRTAVACGSSVAVGSWLQARRARATKSDVSATPAAAAPSKLGTPVHGKTIIVGVGGASGSGKSSICRRISDALGEDAVTTMSFDSYYLGLAPGEDPATHNFDHPESLDIRLLASHLQALKVGVWSRCRGTAAVSARIAVHICTNHPERRGD